MKTAQNNKVSTYDLMYAKDCNTGYQSAAMDAMECDNDDDDFIAECNDCTFDSLYYQCTNVDKSCTYIDTVQKGQKPNCNITSTQFLFNTRKHIINYLFNDCRNFENRLLTENFSIEFFNLLNIQQRKHICKIVLVAWRTEQKQTVNKYLYNAIRFYKLV